MSNGNKRELTENTSPSREIIQWAVDSDAVVSIEFDRSGRMLRGSVISRPLHLLELCHGKNQTCSS